MLIKETAHCCHAAGDLKGIMLPLALFRRAKRVGVYVGGKAQYCHGEVGGRGEGHIAPSYTLEWANYVLSRAFGGGAYCCQDHFGKRAH